METRSLCPICLRVIPARYEQRGHEIFFNKRCPEHGFFETLFWRDAAMFFKWQKQAVHALKNAGLPCGQGKCPFNCGLCGEHEGKICTAVMEITYRCNLRCAVCFADTEKSSFDPSIEQIEAMYRTALRYGGVCSIQLCGGEPTLREDLPSIITLGKEMGFRHIQVNTNGLRLANEPEYALCLAEAGADLVYLQFDGVDDVIYKKIRGRRLLAEKCAAIEHCGRANLGVLLVPTVMPGLNLAHLGEIIEFAKKHMPVVKGVHFQPVSYFGRFPGNAPRNEHRCSLCDIIHALEEQTNGEITQAHLVPRKRFSPLCSFSALYYLPPQGRLQSVTHAERNAFLDERTDFPQKANAFTNKYWRMSLSQQERNGGSPMREFRARLRTHTLAISGMGFQDVWNIDIGRLQGCCVSVISADAKAIPLCAFHLTSASGTRLYRNDQRP